MSTNKTAAKEKEKVTEQTAAKEELSKENLEKAVKKPDTSETHLEFNLGNDLSIPIKCVKKTKNKKESILVGIGKAQQAEEDLRISLGDLIKIIDPDASYPGILDQETITFEYVLLVYKKVKPDQKEEEEEEEEKEEEEEPQSKWLLGIDLNLMALDIANIPLLGSLFESGWVFNLAEDLLLLYSNDIFTKEDVDFINKQLGEDLRQIAIPEGAEETDKIIHSGINVSGKFTYSGDGIINLSSAHTSDEDSVETDDDSVENDEDSVETDDEEAQYKISIWKKVQKQLGPFHLDKIGITLDLVNLTLSFAMDAEFKASGFSLAVEELTIGSPLRKFEPFADFESVAVAFENSTVSLAGALVKFHGKDDAGKEFTEFIGELKVDIASKLKLLAIAGLAKYNDRASFFGYGFVGFIFPFPLEPQLIFTGLALGFGFNQGIHAPPAWELENFPLVADVMAMDMSQTKTLGEKTEDAEDAEDAEKAEDSQKTKDVKKDNQEEDDDDEKDDDEEDDDEESPAKELLEKLDSLNKYIFPSVNTYFGAVGLKFSFEPSLDGFVLLMVEAGNRWEFDLLGMASMTFPPEVKDKKFQIARIGISLTATIAPNEGFIGISAALTSDSYILSKDFARPEGGMALYCWYGNEYAGDFVITIGGYHPNFSVPSHYPRVSRLGCYMNLPGPVHLSSYSRMYFALCPHGVMAGWENNSSLTIAGAYVSFNLTVDFIMAWKPFHYDLNVYVSFHVSAHFWFVHISLHVGAYVHVWGPDISGEVEFWAGPLSIGFSFGANAYLNPEPIDWSDFRNSFLPADNVMCSIRVEDGFINEVKQQGVTPKAFSSANRPLIVVNPKNVKIATDSMIPTKQSAIGSESASTVEFGNTNFGIAPMGLSSSELVTTQAIKITRKGKSESVETDFTFTPIKRNFPKGKWGQSLKPSLNENRFIEDALSGFEITPKTPPKPGETQDLATQKLQFDSNTLTYSWENIQPFEYISCSSSQEELLTALGF